MTIMRADSLLVEQRWTVGSLLLRSRYRVEVYDTNDQLLAVVDELRRTPLTGFLRKLSLSRFTAFHLRAADPHGRPLLFISKAAGIGRRPTRVTASNGEPVGSIVRRWRRDVLLDVQGQHLGLLGDVAHIWAGEITRRNGRRVRRDVIRLHQDSADPARALAVAAGVAYDIVRGRGTNHLSRNVAELFPM